MTVDLRPSTTLPLSSARRSRGRVARFFANCRRDYVLILIVLPVVVHYLIFSYWPMYGQLIAFKDFDPFKGVFASPWASHGGFGNFLAFFRSQYFTRVIRNTLLISVYSLIFGFPVPLIFAFMLNELRNARFKKIIQSVSYVPHFISTVVVCSLIFQLLSPSSGIVNRIIVALGGRSINFMMRAEWFRTVFVASGIWQSFGWSSIIFLAALTGIDQQLYEAATVDGAGRMRRIWHISLPGISNTVIILLLFNIGSLMSVGFEKVILLYNETTAETAEVISSYVYHRGLVQNDYSFGSAVGLFNSLINLSLVIVANRIARRYSEVSLW